MRDSLWSWRSVGAALLVALSGAPSIRAVQGDRVLQSGEVIALRMTAGLSSKTSRAGDTFSATVTRDVRDDRGVLVPTGAIVEGHVTSVEPAKRLSRSGTIAVDFDRIKFADGRTVQIVGQLTSVDPEQRRQIDADEGEIAGSSTTKRNVIFIGGGAGAGAIIGAVSGSTGAGVGVGAGLGTAAVLLSKGNEAQIDPGFEFGLQLLKAVAVPAGGGRGGGRGGGAAGGATRDELVFVQSYLRDRDYYAGPIDGKMTATTKAALLRFQREARLADTGTLDAPTARELGLLDDAGNRTVPLRIVGVDTRTNPDGGLDVTIAAQAPSGGWTPVESHFVSRDALHVYMRGVAPDGPATQALTRQEARFSLSPADAESVTRYVVHGDGPDVSGELGAGGGAAVDLVGAARRVDAALLSYERALGVRTARTGEVTLTGRDYTAAEVELYFSLSSLASSLQLYNSVAPGVRDRAALQGAAQVLVRAARQVDRAVGRAGTARTTPVEREWPDLRATFASFAQSAGLSIDRDEK